MHCETIASRSVLHDWTLAVHRHARLHQVLLIERGGGEATLDGRVVQPEADAGRQRAGRPCPRLPFRA